MIADNLERYCYRRRSVWAGLLALFVLLAVGCGLTDVLEGTTAPTSNPEQRVEDEIVTFMIEYITENEIEPMIDIIAEEDIPLIDTPPDEFIIIWLPPSATRGEDPWHWLDDEQPNGVWLYSDGDVSEREAGAIEEYRQEYIEPDDGWASIFQWGYYEFGLLSISENEQDAEVYLSATCGSLCGHGVVLTLQRSSGGVWEIVNTEVLWVS
jgi:hypothetical protein